MVANKYMTFLILILLTSCSHRPWTKTEKGLLVASSAMTLANVYSTKHMLDGGHYEMNPITGKHPDDHTIWISASVTQLLAILAADYFERYRKWILGGKLGVNTALVIHDYSLEDSE